MIDHCDAELELHELEIVCGGGSVSETKAILSPHTISLNQMPLKSALEAAAIWGVGNFCET
jgi:hypothetical protein